MRTTIDFAPLFRSTVGFDRLTRLLEQATPSEEQAYPPYNIEKTAENAYRITLAVAGFSEDELELVAHENTLIIKGKQKSDNDNTANNAFLYRGIAARAFERRFQLADHVQVKGANLANGLLQVELVREIPEQLKPRKVAISTGTAPQIEQKAA
ncbi:Hsp20 family protein [Roseiterribacter gracilis]|uniref:Heat-shock protein Hsp20 n=1 Tax=Roseiterribacter gracilis TaxID=2812848 RepID=A0A8S8X8I4_9PROT|nr:heat-shock protein Hsp20 [Rhodospirillales bacterium TMPK1]